MIKKGSAAWKGGFKEGAGTVSTETGVLKNAPYGFKARFEDGPGTNPEELIAAAHAACFTMALSAGLGKDGFTADSIETERRGAPRESGRRFRDHAQRSHLRRQGAQHRAKRSSPEIAEITKSGCPVSKVLNAKISLVAKLQLIDPERRRSRPG